MLCNSSGRALNCYHAPTGICADKNDVGLNDAEVINTIDHQDGTGRLKQHPLGSARMDLRT